MSFALRKLSFALALVTSACAGDTKLSPCDIREPSCQFDVFMAVQDVRGSVWDPWLEPPPMDVISEAQYRAVVIAGREQAQQLSGVDYLTPALKLLRMIDPNETPDAETDFKVASVAAYYDANAHLVTIIDRGTPSNESVEVQTLAHELVHAAQDRDVGFGRLYQHVVTADHVNALSALLEGEATAYGLLVDAKQLDIPKGGIRWSILADWTNDIRRRVFADLSPYRIANTELPYSLGGTYVSAAYVQGGPLAVRRIYDDPPLSAARFMIGHGQPGDVAAAPWTCGIPRAPAGFALRIGDELGAISMYAFATRFLPIEAAAWERASTWAGDRFYVFSDTDDDNALIVVWLLRCTSAQTAALLQAQLDQGPWARSIQTFLRDDTLHVFATSSPLAEPYDAWTGCDPP